MPGLSPLWLPSVPPKHLFRVFVIALFAGFLAAGSARAFDTPKVVDAAKTLDDETLDSVSAGAASVTLNLSASATGPTALTSTEGHIAAANTTILRIALDPSTPTPAPAPAHARLLSVSAAELIFAAGNAAATGASDAQCTATAIPVGDITFLTQSKVTTAISAICSCSTFVIGNITP